MNRYEWEYWRRPLGTAAVLLTICLLAAMYVWRPMQWWTLTMDGLAPANDTTGMNFLRDSVYVVRLGGHENAPYPIRVAVFYSGTGVSLSPGDVRRAIERAIDSRVGARRQVVGENPVHHMLAPSVTVAFDLWSEGGVRGEVVLRCPHQHGGADGPVGVVEGVSSMRASIAELEGLSASIGTLLSDASRLRCTESVAGYTPDSPRVINSIATQVVSLGARAPDSAGRAP